MFNPNLFENARCRVCNSVSHSEIASDLGGMSPHTFRLEDDGLGFICYECHSEIEDVETEFYMEDDSYDE